MSTHSSEVQGRIEDQEQDHKDRKDQKDGKETKETKDNRDIPLLSSIPGLQDHFPEAMACFLQDDGEEVERPDPIDTSRTIYDPVQRLSGNKKLGFAEDYSLSGFDAMFIAIYRGDRSLVSCLLQGGYDPNRSCVHPGTVKLNWTPLLYALARDQYASAYSYSIHSLPVIDLLVGAGAKWDVSLQDVERPGVVGQTLLDLAIRRPFCVDILDFVTSLNKTYRDVNRKTLLAPILAQVYPTFEGEYAEYPSKIAEAIRCSSSLVSLVMSYCFGADNLDYWICQQHRLSSSPFTSSNAAASLSKPTTRYDMTMIRNIFEEFYHFHAMQQNSVQQYFRRLAHVDAVSSHASSGSMSDRSVRQYQQQQPEQRQQQQQREYLQQQQQQQLKQKQSLTDSSAIVSIAASTAASAASSTVASSLVLHSFEAHQRANQQKQNDTDLQQHIADNSSSKFEYSKACSTTLLESSHNSNRPRFTSLFRGNDAV